MKKLFVICILMVGSSSAALELCDFSDDGATSNAAAVRKITQVSGERARQIWEQMQAPEVPPKPQTFDRGHATYNAKAKYSANVNCFKYQPLSDDETPEPLPCEIYTCNISDVSTRSDFQ